jgi:hypothetical protein
MALATQIPWQLKFFDGMAWTKQPALWPILAIAGMLVFGLLQTLQYWFHKDRWSRQGVLAEIRLWILALEFAGWFLAYVAIVPWAGYLPTTLVFCLALTRRLGYRSARMLAASLLVALAVVVLFKSVLQVKIPGGALYDLLPHGVRNVMILYF